MSIKCTVSSHLIDTIGPAVVISTLDLAKGYWLIPESKDKTAFTTIRVLLSSWYVLLGLLPGSTGYLEK